MQNVHVLRAEPPSTPPDDPDVGPWTGPVSEFSDYADPVWRFEHEVPGYPDVILRWDVNPPADSRLHPSEWVGLLGEGKRLLWSLTTFNARGRNMRGCDLGAVHAPLLCLLEWLAEHDCPTTADLWSEVAKEYLEHLDRTIGRQSRKCLQRGSVARYVDVVIRIHEQRDWVFYGREDRLDAHPFEGRTASAEAAGISSREKGWIPPVPDEVWSPVVGRALEWLGEPQAHVVKAAWVIRRLECRKRRLLPGGSDIAEALRAERQGKVTLDWFVGMAKAGGKGVTVNEAKSNIVLWRTFRSLHGDVRDACTIVIQALLGMRISEVVGLRAARRRMNDPWPACVEARRSRSGLTEIFFLKGHLFKGQDKPLATEWVAGSRPRGTDHIPPAVKAVLVLDGLFGAWRGGNRFGSLMETVRFDPKNVTVKRYDDVRSDAIAAGQRRFIKRHVDLPAAWRDYRVSTHQWRKSFAIHMVKLDERLLGAVSEHFKHMSIALTETGYVGCDPELLDLINDEGLRLAAEMVHRAGRGRVPLAGKMADTLRERAPGIIEASGARGEGPEGMDRLADLMRAEDVRLWPSSWGYCLFRPEVARCHREAKGEFDLSARQPEYGFRHPGLCSDCANFLVDETHEGFWRGRHAENQAMLDACSESGDELGARVAEERMRVSSSYLKQLEKAALAKEANHAG